MSNLKNFVVRKGLEVAESIKLNNKTVTTLLDSANTLNLVTANSTTASAVQSLIDSSYVSARSATPTTVVATMAALGSVTGMVSGDQALVTGVSKIFMYNGTGWYVIATIINEAPSAITGVDSAYTLAQNGTATVINAIATDPEGLPLSWSSSTSGLGDIATITQGTGDSSNYFTVTPATSGSSSGGTFTLTIAATDNVNGAVNFPASFTLTFVADWTTTAQQSKLTASDAGSNDFNGISVDIKGDRAITGARGEKAAYIWKRSATALFGSIANTTLNNQSADLYSSMGSGSSPQLTGFIFNANGTKIITIGKTHDKLDQWSCSTAYDITSSSLSHDSVQFSVASQATHAECLRTNNDGTKLYVVCSGTDKIYEYDLSTAYDISTASYDNVNFAVTQDNNPRGIFFKPDGQTMYLAAGSTHDKIWQYSLSTAWDLSTISYANKVSPTVYAQTGSWPQDVVFLNDGAKMVIIGQSNDALYQYNLTTAWDVSTASYANASFSTSSQDTIPSGLTLHPADSTKLFLAGHNNGRITQYNLDASVWAQEAKIDRSADGSNAGIAVAMSTDNNYVILGSPSYGGSSKGAGIVYVRSGTSWTFQAALVPSDVAANDEAGLDVSISSDGTYATVGAQNENSGQGAAYVFIRSGTSWTQQQKITEPTRENTARFGAAAKLNDAGDVLMCSSPLSDEAVGNAGAAFIFTRSGTTWSYSTYVAGSDAGGSDYAGGTGSGANQQNASDINADGDLIVLGAYGHNTGGVGNSGAAYIFKKGSTHYDIAGATFTAAEYVHANFTNCTAITFNGDGTKIFAAGGGYDRIASYTLTTAYDISTASYDSNPLVTSSYEGNPNGLQFNADGTKLFFCGSAANRIFVYNLTTGYDLSTASIGNSGNGVSFASQDNNTRDMKFKPDGTVLYVVGQQYDKVYQYSLSTAFDITTISYASKSFSVTSQESTPEGIDFTPDGTKMFIIGEQYNDVFQYNLSTAWDVSTASYANISYDLGSRQAQSSAVIFNPNGTKMFTAGRSADNINEFDTSAKSYSQVTKLTPPSNVLNQDFGETVAISGNTVAIGFQSAGGGGANAVSLVYDTSDESTWTLRKTFAGSDVAANYAYGFSIAIDETNKSIIVGSPGVVNQTPSPGAAYVFTAS